MARVSSYAQETREKLLRLEGKIDYFTSMVEKRLAALEGMIPAVGQPVEEVPSEFDGLMNKAKEDLKKMTEAFAHVAGGSSSFLSPEDFNLDGSMHEPEDSDDPDFTMDEIR